MCRSSSIARLIDNLFSRSADDQRSKFHDEPNEKKIEYVSTHNMTIFFFPATKSVNCMTKDYCGDKGTCLFHPLRPDFAVCKCWIGYVFNDKQLCVGESPCGAVILTYCLSEGGEGRTRKYLAEGPNREPKLFLFIPT